jgi:selT/selW/selH-like putative selenoprotein
LQHVPAEVELKKSGGGAFEITIDGKLVFSKLALGRFPTDEELDQFVSRGGARDV